MTSVSLRCAVVGAGRVGAALIAALDHAGLPVSGPFGRGADPSREAVDLVLLCVPDGEIAAAAAAVTPRADLVVAHCSGATTLAPLAPHRAASLHPLMTILGAATTLDGVPAAVAGSDDDALARITALATALGMAPFHVDDADRAAYHAAASIASNFLVTLQWAATTVGALDRRALGPLIRATVDNWLRVGPHAALTGPIARGDTTTVARQRAAVAERAPELTDLFDVLAAATGRLAGERDRDATTAGERL